jgi:hypothetical protein
MKELIILFIALLMLVIISYFGVKRYNKNIKYIQDYEFRDIEYACLLINEMWNKLSDKDKKEFWGKSITKFPANFSNSLINIEEIPYWCFY